MILPLFLKLKESLLWQLTRVFLAFSVKKVRDGRVIWLSSIIGPVPCHDGNKLITEKPGSTGNSPPLLSPCGFLEKFLAASVTSLQPEMVRANHLFLFFHITQELTFSSLKN